LQKTFFVHILIIDKLICVAKKNINIDKIFPEINDHHILDQNPLNNHLLQLISLIFKYYFVIRLHNKSLNKVYNSL
jgi:hypothetical protein